MEACLEHGYELPSVYLERGGRLRCVAQRGYWQVYDGLASGAGVLGTTYERGTTQVVGDFGDGVEYIRAIPTVVSEVCVPLMVDGQPAGVLNVESRSCLQDADVAWVEELGVELERRLDELGGRPREEPPEMLARFAYELACLDDRDRAMRHTLTAAVSVSGMRGACLFLAHDGEVAAAADSGRLGRMLATLAEGDVRQLADYVSRATSSYTVGEGQGDGFEATHVLRDSGVGSLVVLALVANGRREGVLVLVDAQPQPGIVALIPLLEMLAATSAAMIAAAETREALQRSQRILGHQARHDALTGLANRSGLLEQLRRELDAEGRRAGVVLLFVDWTASRTSTTCTATAAVTCCSLPWATGCATLPGTATWWRASAATSSWCSARGSTASTRRQWSASASSSGSPHRSDWARCPHRSRCASGSPLRQVGGTPRT